MKIFDPDNIGIDGAEHKFCHSKLWPIDSYRFSGTLDMKILERSFYSIINAIDKFEYRLIDLDDNIFEWNKVKIDVNRFYVVETDDIEKTSINICKTSFLTEITERCNNYPVIFVVIKGNGNEYILSFFQNHLYVDARSSQHIFNKIIDYYNALACDDIDKINILHDSVRNMQTAHYETIVPEILNSNHFIDHKRNIANLCAYQTCDAGGYVIKPEIMSRYEKAYRNADIPNATFFVELKDIIRFCRTHYPGLSRNSIACAIIVQAIDDLNVSLKKKSIDRRVSFMMVSNLLSSEMRGRYSGNYVSSFPVTVECNQKLCAVANDINERVLDCKTSRLDLSVRILKDPLSDFHTLSEQEFNDAIRFRNNVSFMISNSTNIRFCKEVDFLQGCQALEHKNTVRLKPDAGYHISGMNLPCFYVNMCPDDRLCISVHYVVKEVQLEIVDKIKDLVGSLLDDFNQAFISGQSPGPVQ